jgi:hypothetical protein
MQSTSNTSIAADGKCVDFGCDNICSNITVTAPGAPTGGGCATVNAAPTPLPLVWTQAHDLCVPATPTSFCKSACLPAPGAFQHAGCIAKATTSDEECPAGFPKKKQLHGKATDTRSCSCGACAAPAGGNCGGAVTLYACASCNTNGASIAAPIGICLPATINCGGGPAVRSASYAGLLTAGSCAPATAVVKGAAVEASTVTICCP